MKAVVAAFNQEKALVGTFSVITNLRMDLRFKLYYLLPTVMHCCWARSLICVWCHLLSWPATTRPTSRDKMRPATCSG